MEVLSPGGGVREWILVFIQIKILEGESRFSRPWWIFILLHYQTSLNCLIVERPYDNLNQMVMKITSVYFFNQQTFSEYFPKKITKKLTTIHEKKQLETFTAIRFPKVIIF